MAENSKPNTFSEGMVTDLDPGYQTKQSYFEGINIRVVTNGDKSFSLENVQGPKRVTVLNTLRFGTLGSTYESGGDRYVIHGAVIVDDYMITIEATLTSTSKAWKINKYLLSAPEFVAYNLWTGLGLFSDDAGELDMESIVETETIHRIYATDGLTSLKSVNVRDSLIGLSVVDFEVFKPNIMASASIVSFSDATGGLLCGAYSYVYRFYTQDQSNYTEWSPMSRTINVPVNSVIDNDSLTIRGGTGADVSSHTIGVKISGIPVNYTNIEIARIHFTSENVSSIAIIEKGEVLSSEYEFIHSGFETETMVTGGIASTLIKNDVWNVCKSLAKADNRLYASNLDVQQLSSTYKSIDDVSVLLDTFKVKAYRALWNGNGEHSGWWGQTVPGLNEHRHKTRYNLGSPVDDATTYFKFIKYNFNTSENPRYVLGTETQGFTLDGNDGFRITFQHESYPVDRTSSQASSSFGTTEKVVTNGQDRHYNVPFKVTTTDPEYLDSVKGPINPKWDHEFRSFRRGECYRFGIILIDLHGVESFVHHIGDVKMPDGNDPNNYKLDADGTGAIPNGSVNWAPFSMTHEGSWVAQKTITAHALIPRIDVRLPESVKSIISGYRIVRAELKPEDKVMITQGLASDVLKYDTTSTDSSVSGRHGVGCLPHTRLFMEDDGNGNITNIASGAASQVANHLSSGNSGMLIDTPDVTIGGMDYELTNGYEMQLGYLMMGRGLNDYGWHGIVIYDGLSSTGGEWADGVHSQHHKYSPIKLYSDFNEYTLSGYNQESVSALSDIVNAYNSTQVHQEKNDTAYIKTVVSGEVVSGSKTGFSGDFVNAAAIDGDGTPTPISSVHSLGFFGKDKLRGNDKIGSGTKLLVSMVGNWVNTGSLKSASSGNWLIPGEDKFDEDWNLVGTSSVAKTGYTRGKWIVDLVRKTNDGSGGTNFEQYGGSNAEALQNTRYIDCSTFTPVSTFVNLVSTTSITGGDTFCDIYTTLSTFKVDSTQNVPSIGVSFPVESPYNIGYRTGSYYGSNWTAVTTQEDTYEYNTAYNQAASTKSYVQKPATFNPNTVFKNKIAASQSKISGEPQDAWSSFLSRDFIEMSLSEGAITGLVNYKNRLYCLQETAIGLVSINTRVLIAGEGAAADIQIVSGTGTVIERYDYLSTQYGSQHYNNSIVTPTGFYTLDVSKEELLKVDGKSIIPVSLKNSYKSTIKSLVRGKDIPVSFNNNLGSISQGLASGYDPEFRECHYTITDSEGDSASFVVSDLDGKLVTKLELKSLLTPNALPYKRYINFMNKFYGVSHEDMPGDNDSLQVFNSGVYQDYSFGVVVNDNPTVNKVFDTSMVFGQGSLGSSYFPLDFNSHTMTDSSSGVPKVGVIGNQTVTEGVLRMPLRSEGPRLRGNWMKYSLAYNQFLVDGIISDDDDKNFNIFAVNTKYRISR